MHSRLRDKDTKCQKTGLRFRVSIQYTPVCAKSTALEWSSVAGRSQSVDHGFVFRVSYNEGNRLMVICLSVITNTQPRSAQKYMYKNSQNMQNSKTLTHS